MQQGVHSGALIPSSKNIGLVILYFICFLFISIFPLYFMRVSAVHQKELQNLLNPYLPEIDIKFSSLITRITIGIIVMFILHIGALVVVNSGFGDKVFQTLLIINGLLFAFTFILSMVYMIKTHSVRKNMSIMKDFFDSSRFNELINNPSILPSVKIEQISQSVPIKLHKQYVDSMVEQLKKELRVDKCY